jgi:predicted GNAT family N-acyltransferase
MSYITFPLNPSYNKEKFNCGKPLLDSYLHKQAKQDVKRRLSACFILPDEKNNVKGYYTLSSASIERTLLPEDVIRKLPPSYRDLPAILLGRLAISEDHQKQGLGETILLDALRRCYNTSKEIGSMAVIVDPLDQEAVSFYAKYDFIVLPDSGKMFLPMATIAQLFPDEKAE